MWRASVLLRRAAALACVLVLAVPAAAQDDGGDDFDPSDPAGLGKSGMDAAKDVFKPKVRGWTSAQLLRRDWDHGYAPSRPGTPPLALKAALAALAGHDDRPLLILRECDGCKRDDHAMVYRDIEDDKTVLYARWYHSVRLSADVLKPDHPFHLLFDGASPPHLVVATLDGSLVTELGPRANQQQYWKVLSGVLRKAYKKDPDAAVKGMLVLLDDLDRCDADISGCDEKLELMRAAKDTESRDFKDLEARRKAADTERAGLLVKGKLLDDLGLKVPAPPPGG